LTSGQQRGTWLFRRPLTEPVTRWANQDAFPLVELELSVTKRGTTVYAFTSMYNQVSMADFIAPRRDEFESIVHPAACPMGDEARTVIWKSDGGWGDPVDWESGASCSRS
jgi:hypothetical protein